MGCGEIEDLEQASMDLYSRVKLRASNVNRPDDRNGDFDNADSENARFGESSWIGSNGVKANNISVITSDPLSIQKRERFMWLLEIAKNELSIKITDKKVKGYKKAEGTKNFVLSNTPAEETAVEMLGELGKGRSGQFTTGDLVWGKIESHPWWPGQIYDESRVTLSIRMQKKKGCDLVAFFGDDTCEWLPPSNVLPFAPNFAEKLKQSKDGSFLQAVEEAVLYVKKKSALGLTCKCRNPFAFKPTNDEGLFDVDVAGYGDGHEYSIKQIEKARNNFKPCQMLSFVKKLALRPNMDVQKNVNMMRNVARAIAYRKMVFEAFDETYDEAFGEPVFNKEDIGKKKAHEERKKDDSKKRVEQSASKVQIKENISKKRALEDASVPWYREFEADYPVQDNKRRSILDSKAKKCPQS